MADDERRTSEARIWTPSNIITLFRICLVPVFVVALISPWPEWFSIRDVVNNQVKAWVSAGIFILISCTDWIDGYLARKRNEVTDLGKFLDPLADKILVAAALIALVELDVLPSWPVLIILAREFIVSGIRMVAAAKGFVIAASWYGKVKTVLQIIAIVLFIVKDAVDPTQDPHDLVYVVAWLVMLAALVMTIVSMMDYIAKSRPLLFPKKGTASQDGADASADPVRDLAAEVVAIARDKGLTIGMAESLTGGMIAAAITAVPGSSEVLKGALVTYVDEVKHDLLGVDDATLDTVGAVSAPCAEQMAAGARIELHVDVAVSVTGIAGPSGGTPETPVGTVFRGISTADGCSVERLSLQGDRAEVREETVRRALEALLAALRSIR